jgi:hypothetical protein
MSASLTCNANITDRYKNNTGACSASPPNEVVWLVEYVQQGDVLRQSRASRVFLHEYSCF